MLERYGPGKLQVGNDPENIPGKGNKCSFVADFVFKGFGQDDKVVQRLANRTLDSKVRSSNDNSLS